MFFYPHQKNRYNSSVARIRSGTLGKSGLLFEHECLQIMERKFNPGKDPNIRILRSVKLPGLCLFCCCVFAEEHVQAFNFQSLPPASLTFGLFLGTRCCLLWK
jgi:hypothetical protein